MVPSLPYPGCESDGELELFEKLRIDPHARHWTVLHSLWVANHPRRQAGEADFVIVVPSKGVLVLEVKACRRLRVENGEWHYGRDATPDRRGPFRQASDAMHAIRGRLHRDHPQLKRVLFWSGVLFTHTRFELRSPEWHAWQVIDGHGFRDGSIAARLEAILDRARDRVIGLGHGWFDRNSRTPTPTECDRIAEHLRPSYEPLETPADRRRVLDRDLRLATEEQLRILDCCASNARLLVEGPAGTGKTLIAIAAAEREVIRAATGESPRVLFLCFNSLLKGWIERELAPFKSNVHVDTLPGLMRDIAGDDSPPPSAGDIYWRRTLPEKAVEILLSRMTSDWTWDSLIVDEAQDLLNSAYRDVLDLLVAGGLRGGRWRFFGDFERQSIYRAEPSEVTIALAELRKHAVALELRDNCRNTPAIARLAEQLGALQPGYRRILRKDDGRSYDLFYFNEPVEQIALLQQVLDRLKAQGYSDGEITILSTRADETSAATQLDGPWRHRVFPARLTDEGRIRYASVHRFKGLENRAIVLTDVIGIDKPSSRDIFYIGVTRSQSYLCFLCHSSMKPRIQRLMLEHLGL